MMTKNADKKRAQMIMFCMNDMVPQNHKVHALSLHISATSTLLLQK